MRALLSILLVFTASPAAACIRNSVAFNFQDQVNNELNYLICLHNEQNDALRMIASDLDSARAEISSSEASQNDALRALASDLESARAEISRSEASRQSLQNDVDLLRQRIDELEAKQP